ncbi:MAG: amino acid--tRNA ligase-related protein [Chlamydiales bacterium]
MSLELTNRVALLRDRSVMLSHTRTFFAEREVIEVDVPILSRYGSVDPHIELIEAICLGERVFLHSSPEYGMKRLLSEGIGDIYQISHVFRNEEKGAYHTPEFTMIEWYRCGFLFEQMVEETLAFIHLFFSKKPIFTYFSYRELFLHYLGYYPESQKDRDRLLAFEIEPHLDATVITDFPPEEAALSEIQNGIALRFEVFYKGLELANGYYELRDQEEQRKRLEHNNQERLSLGKKIYPIDPLFLEALGRGLPQCCGVAVGFDRLMMLRHDIDTIDQILPFEWEKSE